MKYAFPTIPHSLWNGLMDRISRKLPIRVMRVARYWTHPWSITSRWDEELKEWNFFVEPGFVNGEDFEISVPARLASESTLLRIADGGAVAEGEKPVLAHGIERPWFAVASGETRVIGEGSDAESVDVSASGNLSVSFETVPKFFADAGVVTPNALKGNLTTGVQEVIAFKPEDLRILRAFDVVLFLDRAALKMDVTKGTAALDGFSILLGVSAGRSSPARTKPSLRVMSKYVPLPPATPANLMDGSGDPEFDAVKVATVYFLSSPGASPSDVIDSSWGVYPKHDLFWNLAHASAKIPEVIESKPLTISTGLAGGIGDAISNRFLAQSNEDFNEAVTLIASKSLEGTFWSV